MSTTFFKWQDRDGTALPFTSRKGEARHGKARYHSPACLPARPPCPCPTGWHSERFTRFHNLIFSSSSSSLSCHWLCVRSSCSSSSSSRERERERQEGRRGLQIGIHSAWTCIPEVTGKFRATSTDVENNSLRPKAGTHRAWVAVAAASANCRTTDLHLPLKTKLRSGLQYVSSRFLLCSWLDLWPPPDNFTLDLLQAVVLCQDNIGHWNSYSLSLWTASSNEHWNCGVIIIDSLTYNLSFSDGRPLL